MIVNYDAALVDLIEATLPGVPVRGVFHPVTNLTDTLEARLEFGGIGKQTHRKTESIALLSWVCHLQADQAKVDAQRLAQLDAHADTLLGTLLGADKTAIAGMFDTVEIDQIAAGYNAAETAVQISIAFSFNAVLRRAT